ncbi:hypothetical protein CDAR_401531 [Caerostris darwini]|uniref:Uncharacterized protein n=1 Tax=Caerostris darwini TaxID=1538125 RepID=A0AAV4RUB0_9ARAC|nr:hypothetical protein CDAR_401531 [Caerostris darwini]
MKVPAGFPQGGSDETRDSHSNTSSGQLSKCLKEDTSILSLRPLRTFEACSPWGLATLVPEGGLFIDSVPCRCSIHPLRETAGLGGCVVWKSVVLGNVQNDVLH